MSRLTERELEIPDGVTVTLGVEQIEVKGPHGQLSIPHVEGVATTQESNVVYVKTAGQDRHALAMTGTLHALLRNMIQGVTSKWEKRLEVQGVGYRAQSTPKALTLQLGFSHSVVYETPEGIEISTPSATEVVVSGVDKQRVGQVAAEIRSTRPPDAYKGKGVRYAGEHIRLKEGKKK